MLSEAAALAEAMVAWPSVFHLSISLVKASDNFEPWLAVAWMALAHCGPRTLATSLAWNLSSLTLDLRKALAPAMTAEETGQFDLGIYIDVS